MNVSPEAAKLQSPIDRALALIAPDVQRFEALLERTLEPQREYLTAWEYAIYRRGKKLRPLLLLLSARLNAPDLVTPLPERVLKAAVSLEMLHVATLIHDDIIDKAPQRRGVASVNAARGNDVALLVGDMQFVQAVRCFASGIEVQEDLNLVLLVLDVGYKICCGELDELATDPAWPTQRLRYRYVRTIDRKTAILFQLSCEAGATLMRARKRDIWKVGQYGRMLGRAFQVMDDLADFVSPDVEAGKMRGTDVIRRRVTLPIINALQELPANSPLHRIMCGEPYEEHELRSAIDAVVASNGFIRAYGQARGYALEGIRALTENYPNSELRQTLVDLMYLVVNRGSAALDDIASAAETFTATQPPLIVRDSYPPPASVGRGRPESRLERMRRGTIRAALRQHML